MLQCFRPERMKQNIIFWQVKVSLSASSMAKRFLWSLLKLWHVWHNKLSTMCHSTCVVLTTSKWLRSSMTRNLLTTINMSLCQCSATLKLQARVNCQSAKIPVLLSSTAKRVNVYGLIAAMKKHCQEVSTTFTLKKTWDTRRMLRWQCMMKSTLVATSLLKSISTLKRVMSTNSCSSLRVVVLPTRLISTKRLRHCSIQRSWFHSA